MPKRTPGVLEDADERACDLLPARVVRHRRADVEQIVERRHLRGIAHGRHAEPVGPRRALGRRHSPRVALGLDRLEQVLELVRELACDQHLVLAHPKEAVEVLELDRARCFAVAAGRARPERLLGDDVADELRQLAAGVAGDDAVGALDEMPLDAVVDHLHRQRFPGQVRRARILAAAALGAGEGVEPFLPRQVDRAADARLHLRFVLGGHQLVEIDAGNAVGRAATAKEERRQRGDDVEVLAERQDDEKREHDRHLRPVRDRIAGGERVGRQSGECARNRASREGERALVRDLRHAVGEQREAKAVEGEVGDHDRQDQAEDEDRFAVRLESRRADDEAAVQRIEHGSDDGDLDRVLERREHAGEPCGKRRQLVVADREQLELAQQKREEADEEHRVHDAGAPLAPDHATLQEPVDRDRAQARKRRVEAVLGLQRDDDPELAPDERDEAGHREEQQHGDRGRTHRRVVRVRRRRRRAVRPTLGCATTARLIHVNRRVPAAVACVSAPLA
jgi:hypothetical protein